MVAINIIQFINLPMMFLSEKKSAMPYSKFASSFQAEKKEKMIPSKMGMLIIYVPAFLVGVLYLSMAETGLLPDYSRHLAGWMTMFHFLKRTFETLVVHKYSGSTVASAAKMIGFAYAAQAAMICGTATPRTSPQNTLTATVLFSVGIVGNLFHHYLLANLRSPKTGGGSKYVAPRGGLFAYVAAPHYLFELIGWLGVAIASEQITSYLIFGGMTMYLSARSINQNQWNCNKFSDKEWPRSRRNMIPFIF